MNDIPVNPVTLRFPPELESEFRESRKESDAAFVRVALVAAVTVWSLYAFIDRIAFVEELRLVLALRFLTLPPAAALVFAFTYAEWFSRIQQAATFVLLAGTGLLISWFTWLAPTPADSTYLAGIIVLFFFGYAFSRARFVVASAAGLVIIAAFSTLFALTNRLELAQFIAQSIILLIGNLAGMVASYSLESSVRREFLRVRALAGDVDSAQHQSEWLESLVVERTRDLAETNEQLRSEISERKRAEDRLQYLAAHDVLTGLANRRFFEDQLDSVIARAIESDHQVAMILLDIDKFKQINDGYGHRFGDLLLRKVGERIQNALRLLDTVARLGGDEFAILVPRFESLDDVRTVASRVIESVRAPLTIDSVDVDVTTSAGVALFPDHAEDALGVIRCADSAMYQVKDHGGNAFAFFSRELDVRIARRTLIERRLVPALERNEFELVYQPKLRLADRSVEGVEALLRWKPVDGFSSSPAEFIPIAESSTAILHIGEWVVRTACAAAARMGCAVNVNISARQLQDKAFLKLVESACADCGLDPERLCLEITESVLMQDLAVARDQLLDLRALGIRVSIDDFGTGFSSLQYLSRLPIDELKIDRSFVASVGESGADEAIVKTVVGLGQAVGAKVVAEGVETLAQLRFLEAAGCDHIQGWLVARASDEETIESYVNGSRVG